MSLDVSDLVIGTKYHGQFEERAQGVTQEWSESEKTTMLFLDETRSLENSGSVECGSEDVASMLKPSLSLSKMQ